MTPRPATPRPLPARPEPELDPLLVALLALALMAGTVSVTHRVADVRKAEACFAACPSPMTYECVQLCRGEAP